MKRLILLNALAVILLLAACTGQGADVTATPEAPTATGQTAGATPTPAPTEQPIPTDPPPPTEEPTPTVLDCSAPALDSSEWVACNVIDGVRSRNLAALHGYMADPFIIGYWGSEGRSASPAEITAELEQYLLPADPATPITFTADRGQFPPLAGQPPETLFGPDVNVAIILYSEGWGPDGLGAALLYIAQDGSGAYYWHGIGYSGAHFDK